MNNNLFKAKVWNMLLLIVTFFGFSFDRCSAIAFPGAEGFGAETRGAYELYEQTENISDLPKIIHVTNTNCSGKGSFWNAWNRSGENNPRIIVFDVAGEANCSDIERAVNNIHYVTVAGQTAPGKGFHYRGNLNIRSSSHIIIRGMRIRDGMWSVFIRSSDYDRHVSSHHMIFDHLSLGNTRDETFTLLGPTKNISITNNIMAQPKIMRGQGGNEGHNYALMVSAGAEKITIKNNLITHAQHRAPYIGGGDVRYPWLKGSTEIEFIDNTTYNGRSNWSNFSIARHSFYNGGDMQCQKVVLLGHNQIPGPQSQYKGESSYDFEYIIHPSNHPGGGDVYVEDCSQFYIKGNLGKRRTNQNQPELDIFPAGSEYRPKSLSIVDHWPFPKSNVTYDFDAKEHTRWMLGMDGDVPRIGACPRDDYDSSQINDVKIRGGGWIDKAVSYPSYTGDKVVDSDQDGIPNAWETAHGLNPNNASDAHQMRDGYSELEHYINHFFDTGSSQPSCSSSHLNLCTTQPTCTTANGNWCNNQCQSNSCTGGTVIRADVNQDSEITTTDALLVLRKSTDYLLTSLEEMGWHTSTTTGDVNCDGEVRLNDAVLLLKKAVGGYSQEELEGLGWCE